MGVHDWSKVDSGAWHDFHLAWLAELRLTLNEGLLPSSYYALAEQKTTIYEPDMLTLERAHIGFDSTDEGNVATLARPKTTQFLEAAEAFYRRKERILSIRHVSGDKLVAIIELVSPGNKSSKDAADDLVNKSIDFLKRKLHLVLIDLFEPTTRDPQGLHSRIWETLTDETYQLLPDKPLALASYEVAKSTYRAYVEPLKFGDSLPNMPLYLKEDSYVWLPLQATYDQAWRGVPKHLKAQLTSSDAPANGLSKA